MGDKKITIDKRKKDKKTPLQKINMPENLDEESRKKLAKALKEWLREDSE